MLKKVGILFFVFCIGCCVFAVNNITSDDIFEIKTALFSKNYNQKLDSNEFNTLIKQHKKDTNYLENYYAVLSGYKSYKNNNLKGFFTKKFDIMYLYSLQERNNPRIVYYYNIWGKLQNVEFIHGEYPAYPYFSRKYKPNGQIVDSTYFPSKENSIVFNKDGSKYKIKQN